MFYLLVHLNISVLFSLIYLFLNYCGISLFLAYLVVYENLSQTYLHVLFGDCIHPPVHYRFSSWWQIVLENFLHCTGMVFAKFSEQLKFSSRAIICLNHNGSTENLIYLISNCNLAEKTSPHCTAYFSFFFLFNYFSSEFNGFIWSQITTCNHLTAYCTVL